MHRGNILIRISLAISAGLLVAHGSVYAAQAALPMEKIIDVQVDGQQRSVVSTAGTVRQALAAAGIAVNKADLIEPGLDAALEGSAARINVRRARLATVVDGTRRIRVTTAERESAAIVRAAGITLYPEDTVQAVASDQVLIDDASLVLEIRRSPQRTVVETELMPFAVERTHDHTRPAGERQVVAPGKAGLKRITYQVAVRRGVEVSRQRLAEEIVAQPTTQREIIGAKPTNPLTKARGAHIFTDSRGVAHRETYYDLPMSVVMGACGAGGRYSVRADGAKIDKDGYVIVAAHLGNYPRCSVVETSMGPGKVYDTGGFAKAHPHGFDLATDWTNGDGR